MIKGRFTLPTMALDFDRVDLVVCGTGLPESLVAR